MGLEALVPTAVNWISEQEQWILREGTALTPQESDDARAAGVVYPDRVRVLRVSRVPSIGGPVLSRVAEKIGLSAGDAAGMAMQYGIFLRKDLQATRWVLAHELTHTAQYERLGGITPFLRSYVLDVLAHGYREARMEAEANETARKIAS